MFITKKEFESITLISFYSKMQPLFCLVPTNLSTQFPSWHELTQRPHNSAISVPDLKWSYFAFKGSEQLELPRNWNRIAPWGSKLTKRYFTQSQYFNTHYRKQPLTCSLTAALFLPCYQSYQRSLTNLNHAVSSELWNHPQGFFLTTFSDGENHRKHHHFVLLRSI